jgi:hypothetical protein
MARSSRVPSSRLTGRLAPLRSCGWTHRAACAAPLLLLDSPGGLRRSATVAGLTGRLAPLRYCCWTHRAACAAPLLLLDSPGGLRRSATVARLTGRLAPLRYCCWTHRAACAAPLLLLDSPGGLRRSATVAGGLVLGSYPGFGIRTLEEEQQYWGSAIVRRVLQTDVFVRDSLD